MEQISVRAVWCHQDIPTAGDLDKVMYRAADYQTCAHKGLASLCIQSADCSSEIAFLRSLKKNVQLIGNTRTEPC